MTIKAKDIWAEPILTPDFARSNEPAYRAQIIALYDDFCEGAMTGSQIISKLKTDGTLTEVKIDPTTWIGKADHGDITLGIAPVDPKIRERIVFEDKNFTGDREVLYRLSHELSHFIGPAIERVMPRHLGRIYGAIIHSRSKTGRGLSALGSLDYYKSNGAKLQAHEDITELMNMYLIDPAYLKRFLVFMITSDDAVLKRLGLMNINLDTAKFIFDTIESGIQNWFKTPKP